MAKVTPEQQVLHGRCRRPRRDPLETVRTFQFRRVSHRVLGVFFVAFSASCFTPIVGLFIPGFYNDSNVRPDAGLLLLACGTGLAFAWFGIGYFRCGVQVSGRKLTIRNALRTYMMDAADIRAITLQPRRGIERGTCWVARVELTEGKGIWIDNFECGATGKPPKLDRMAAVEEVRELLGLDADLTAETR